jgi:hypothetical protein
MMTAPEAFLEIETRKINLAYTFDAMWLASVAIDAKKSASALALTSIGAVEALVSKLDFEFQPDDRNITPEGWEPPF